MSACEGKGGEAKEGWTPVQYLWKSRIPLIAAPVLLALQHTERHVETEFAFELPLLLFLALGTGYLRLPFSITWWLVLLAAFALQTRFLLGVATVLSLSVLITWYGLRLRHAAAISALWAGVPVSPGSRRAWQVWDLCVHFGPAVAALFRHGPSLGLLEAPHPGLVTPGCALAALPMSLLWLAGLRLSWGSGCDLALSRHAYRTSVELPKEAWVFVHASHALVCFGWLSGLLLPGTVLGSLALFVLMGRVKQPFTTAWWVMFVTCLWFTYGPGAARLGASPAQNLELLKGMTCICAVTMSAGFYGAQVFSREAFPSMVLNWAVRPTAKWFPWLGKPLLRWSETRSFWILARLGDSCLHLIPSICAALAFRSSLSAWSALSALPMNLIWLWSAGATSLEATNDLYGVEPPLSKAALYYVYGSHWVLCLCAIAHQLLWN